MPHYICLFVDRTGAVVQLDTFERSDHAEAKACALSLWPPLKNPVKCEIWTSGRLMTSFPLKSGADRNL